MVSANRQMLAFPLIEYYDLKSLRHIAQTSRGHFKRLVDRKPFRKLRSENYLTIQCQKINHTFSGHLCPKYGKFLVEAFILLKLGMIRVEDYNGINRFTRIECKKNSLDFLQPKPNKVILNRPDWAAWPCLALMNRPQESWRNWDYSELPKHLKRFQLPLGMCKRIVRQFMENSVSGKATLIKAMLQHRLPRALIEFAITLQVTKRSDWIDSFFWYTDRHIKNAAQMQSPIIANWLVSQADHPSLVKMAAYDWPKLSWRNRRKLKRI